MSYTEPAKTWAEFQARLQSGPEYQLHTTHHRSPADPVNGISTRKDNHAVVFIHGLAASSWSWHHVIDATPAGVNAVCIDLLGHGDSPKPELHAYSVYDHARHVVHAIEGLGFTNVSLVGNSLGGGSALIAATVFAERRTVTVDHFISLEGIGVRQMTPLPFQLVQIPLLPEWLKRFVPAKTSSRLALKSCYHDADLITDEQVAAYAAPAKDPAQPLAAINSARYVKPDDVDDLPAKYAVVEAPTLLIWGSRGNIVPRAVGETLRDLLPNASLTVLPECGHIPHEERPDIVVPMIWDFLS